MGTHNEQTQVAFHNRAREVFFSTYRSFEAAVSAYNRKTEEFRFQQIKKQYVSSLENELQAIAKDVLRGYREDRQSGEVDQMLFQSIKEYLHRFVQKINAL